MATQTGGSINSLFKQYYGRDANADERKYWADKSNIQLRDALMKSDTGSKQEQIKNMFRNTVGREATQDDINYWKNKNFEQLQTQLSKDVNAQKVIDKKEADQQTKDAAAKADAVKAQYTTEWEKDVLPQFEKEKQEQAKRYQDNKDNLEEAYQTALEQGDRDKAIYIQRINENYDTQMKSYALNMNKLTSDFKTSISQQDEDKLKNLNQIFKDYTTANTRLNLDRDVRFKDIDRFTGQQLMANEVNYAERGLYRSGGREMSKEYIGEEAEREKDVYQTAFERHQEDLLQNKEQGTEAVNTTYNRNVGGLKSDYNYGVAQQNQAKAGYGTAKARGLQDQTNSYNDWRKSLDTTYNQNTKDANTSWQDYVDQYNRDIQKTRATYINQGNTEGWNPSTYQGTNYNLPTLSYNNK